MLLHAFLLYLKSVIKQDIVKAFQLNSERLFHTIDCPILINGHAHMIRRNPAPCP